MVKYLVQHGDDLNLGQTAKEFSGRGSKRAALKYAKARAEAGLLTPERPIEVFRGEFDRLGCLTSQTTVESYRTY